MTTTEMKQVFNCVISVGQKIKFSATTFNCNNGNVMLSYRRPAQLTYVTIKK